MVGIVLANPALGEALAATTSRIVHSSLRNELTYLVPVDLAPCGNYPNAD
jgi:hypothetical protein